MLKKILSIFHVDHVVVACVDIIKAIKNVAIIQMLSWLDIKRRYRRSVLGPFWMTISMAVTIASIGIVFGSIFSSDLSKFLPFLCIGMIIWGFITSSLNEGCNAFMSAESIIKQLPMPMYSHVINVIYRNFVVMLHNIVIFPIVLLILGTEFHIYILYFLLGFILLVANLGWMVLLLSVICTRYRDLQPIVGSIIQVFFYITPIMWMPNQLNSRVGETVLNLNPFYHLLEIVRSPLIGDIPKAINYNVTITILVIGWAITLCLYGKYKNRIAFWI